MADATRDTDVLLALLDFHVAAGVDCCLDEQPHNRFAEDRTRVAQPAQPATAGPAASQPEISPAPTSPPLVPARLPRAAPASPEDAAATARSQAASASSLQELQSLLAGFDGCALRASAKRPPVNPANRWHRSVRPDCTGAACG